MAQMRIFLSHSSADREFADALAKALRDAGADVWYDESHLGTGQLLREINNQLTTRTVFVVILSKSAFASNWVKRECEWAYNLYDREPDRKILPVVAQQLDRSDWNEMLWFEGFRRVEGPTDKPYSQAEAIAHTLRLLILTPPAKLPKSAQTPPIAHALADNERTKETLIAAQQRSSKHAAVRPSATRGAANQMDETARGLIKRGRSLYAEDRYAAARPLFERATQLEPNNFAAWLNLGRVGIMTDQWNAALVACERAIALNSKSAIAWANRGAALNGLTRYTEGLLASERAILLAPALVQAWNNKGAALNGLARYAEALTAFEQALTLDAEYEFAWRGKACALHGLGRTNEANEADARAKSIGE
ncbi:MAG TPA: toll/interleukin-1 receptor domain-containing protein [Ktedonobacterales bacterium]|jgi:tetratricopeptide (TPR) repeat protein